MREMPDVSPVLLNYAEWLCVALETQLYNCRQHGNSKSAPATKTSIKSAREGFTE